MIVSTVYHLATPLATVSTVYHLATPLATISTLQNLLIHYSLTKSSQSANLKNPKSGHNQENELKYGFETRVEEPDPVGFYNCFPDPF